MTAAARFVLLVVASAGIAAALLAPQRSERIAIMRDENRYGQIVALLEPQLAKGDDAPEVLAALGRAHAALGNHRRAAELLERYLAQRPDDGEAYGLLADVYGRMGETTRQTELLERSVELAPSLNRIAGLGGMYRHQDRPNAERALLTRYEAKLTVASGLVLWLATLRVAAGDRDGALRLLMQDEITEAAPGRNVAQERILLAQLLAENGQSAAAVRLGRQWLRQWREPFLASSLLQAVAPRAPVAEAAELADEVVRLHPAIRFYLVHELAASGAKSVARHLLEDWTVATPSPSDDEIAAFLSACDEQGTPETAWRSFATLLRISASADPIGRFAEAMANKFGIGSLAPFWPYLPRAAIAQRPVLAAQLAFHEQDLELAKSLVVSTDPIALNATERPLWLSLLRAVTSPSQGIQILQAHHASGHLPPDLDIAYARLAGQLEEDGDAAAVGNLPPTKGGPQEGPP